MTLPPAATSNGVDPIVRAFLDSLEAQGILQWYNLSLKEVQQVLLHLQSGEIEKLPAQIEERVIHVDGKYIFIRIVKPVDSKELLPVIMYFHGGTGNLGNAFTHDRLLRELAIGVHAAVVFVHFTPLLDAQYPVILEEAYAATEYIANKGQLLGIDGINLAVGGDSGGGNLAAAVTLLAKERNGPKIKFQLLFYPITDATLNQESYRLFGDEFLLRHKVVELFWDAYAPDKEVKKLITVSPLQADLQSLEGLPQALVITAEFDVFRDEGEAYAQKLNEAGVPITATRYLGIIHDFVVLNSLSNTKATRAAINQAVTSLKSIFNN